MVTFAYLLVFTASTFVIGTVDSYLYKISIFEAIYNLYRFNPGTDKWMVGMGAIVGFLYSIGTDIRLYKQKQKKNKAVNNR